MSRKRRFRCDWSANPHASATSASGSLVLVIITFARSHAHRPYGKFALPASLALSALKFATPSTAI